MFIILTTLYDHLRHMRALLDCLLNQQTFLYTLCLTFSTFYFYWLKSLTATTNGIETLSQATKVSTPALLLSLPLDMHFKLRFTFANVKSGEGRASAVAQWAALIEPRPENEGTGGLTHNVIDRLIVHYNNSDDYDNIQERTCELRKQTNERAAFLCNVNESQKKPKFSIDKSKATVCSSGRPPTDPTPLSTHRHPLHAAALDKKAEVTWALSLKFAVDCKSHRHTHKAWQLIFSSDPLGACLRISYNNNNNTFIFTATATTMRVSCLALLCLNLYFVNICATRVFYFVFFFKFFLLVFFLESACAIELFFF